MNKEQVKIIQETPGFIAALDQSGGSTPGALARYGISSEEYSSEEEMFDLVQDMRARIIKSPAFSSDKVIGAILFEKTMDSQIDGKYTGDVLAEKGIVPFIKVDQGLEEEENGVQLMKDLDRLDELLQRSKERNMFGTKMRSVINSYNEAGIKAIVDQQFEVGKKILDQGLVPILEPEVNIQAENRAKIDEALTEEILKHLNQLDEDQKVMLKLSIPETANTYQALIDHPNVLRVVALSGGYTTDEANEKLAANKGLIASFSRALLQDLNVDQSDEEFNQALGTAIDSIYQASIQ